MLRRRAVLASIVLLVLAIVFVLWRRGVDRPAMTAVADPEPASPGAGPAPAAHRRVPRTATGLRWPSFDHPDRDAGFVEISGTVLDASSFVGVADVEVVFRNLDGESSVQSARDGRFEIAVPVGVYRAYVRSSDVLSIAEHDHRQPAFDEMIATPGEPDLALVPLVVARTDVHGLELAVLRSGELAGRVLDPQGHPLGGATVHVFAHEPRPSLGTDLIETEPDGSFTMRVPAGQYGLVASHPRYAGLPDGALPMVTVPVGGAGRIELSLAAGCVLAGHVTSADGKPATGGVIERVDDIDEQVAYAIGAIGEDGTFRIPLTVMSPLVLRAWATGGAPSAIQRVTCVDGARFPNLAFTAGRKPADLEGVVLDHQGHPVAGAIVDLDQLDRDSQFAVERHERTDARGHWEAHGLLPGRYRLTSYVRGRGVVAAVATPPKHDLRLQLGGTGRLTGVAAQLPSASFDLSLVQCEAAGVVIPLPREPRLVAVTKGAFTVEDLPACALSVRARWHDSPDDAVVQIPADGTATIGLAVGPPHPVHLHGVVRDLDGKPIAGAEVVAGLADGDGNGSFARTLSDPSGHYALLTITGGRAHASFDGREVQRRIRYANDEDVTIDFVISDDSKIDDE